MRRCTMAEGRGRRAPLSLGIPQPGSAIRPWLCVTGLWPGVRNMRR